MKTKTTTSKKSKKTKITTEKIEKSEEKFEEVKLSPFDYVKSIQSTKINLIRNDDNPELAEKNYVPFIVNKALSFYPDSILYANEMNYWCNINNLYQYEYYLNSIRSMKRNFLWLKHNEDENLALIQDFYKVNSIRAKEYLTLLTKNDLEKIKTKYMKGGVVK